MQDSVPDISSPLLKEKPAAAYITRSVSSLRRGRKDGTGPKFVRIGRSIRYLKSELDAYIAARVALTTGEVRHD
jgi:predicted DNA-binding transcriptional regulator AlpA